MESWDFAGIDHVELYVGDARQSAFWFGAALGFTLCGQGGPDTGLTDQRSLLLSQGDIRLVLTSGLAAGHPAAEYVHRHGDGVAVVALRTGDAAAAYATLLDRGATAVEPPRTYRGADTVVVTAAVAGVGDVVHRLVERHGPRGEFLPGAVAMTEPDPAPGPLREIDHLAVCVPPGQLGPVSRRYQEVFGFEQIFEEYIDVAGQGMASRVVQSPSRRVTFVLIEPDPSRRPGQVDDFLRWHAGSGVQHLGLRTDDIVTAVRTLAARGVRFLATPAAYYDTLTDRVGALARPVAQLRELGILADRDHWGQLLQIFTESMHVRRTLFLEVIERRGALTFGSGNVKALYEAKERELAHSSSDAGGS